MTIDCFCCGVILNKELLHVFSQCKLANWHLLLVCRCEWEPGIFSFFIFFLLSTKHFPPGVRPHGAGKNLHSCCRWTDWSCGNQQFTASPFVFSPSSHCSGRHQQRCGWGGCWCWMIKETCLFDETVQFTRNHEHCSAASHCCCGSF